MTARIRSPLAADLMARLDAIESAGRARSFGRVPLMTFVTHADFCGLNPTPAQRAVLEASSGERPTCDPELVRKLFRCGPERLPPRPRVVVVSGGGRSGKTSNMMAPACLHAAWTVPVIPHGGAPISGFPDAQRMAPGERPRVIIISSKTKLAKKTFQFIKGLVEHSPILRRAVVGEITANQLNLLRPDGLVVEIMTGVASAGGEDARSASLLFFGLDEAAFLRGEGYVANDEDLFSAGSPRVVPYGQSWMVTTPWVEEDGLVERLIKTSWGTHEDALVVARVSTRVFNPTWDPSGAIERAEKRRPGGEENVQREIHGIPLAKGTKGLFPPDAIKRALERLRPEGDPEARGAGADIAHDSDHAAIVLAARWRGGKFAPTLVLQDDPADGAQPSAVYARYTDACADAGVLSVAADGHYKATFKEALGKRRVRLETDLPHKADVYLAAKELFTEDRIALGGLPSDVREDIADQLRSVLKKPGSAGATVIIQKRLADGNHCDAVSALVLALWRVGSCEPKLWEVKPTRHREAPPPPPPRPARPTDRAFDRDQARFDRWR